MLPFHLLPLIFNNLCHCNGFNGLRQEVVRTNSQTENFLCKGLSIAQQILSFIFNKLQYIIAIVKYKQGQGPAIIVLMNIDVAYIAIVLGVILFSMTFHEIMHGFVAYWLGDNTAKDQGRLSFNPIKHIDPFMTIILPIILAVSGLPIFGGAKPVPFNPHNVRWGEWGATLVAVAGPLTNFVIAFISFGVWTLLGMPGNGVEGQIFGALVAVNLGFFVFNLIPIPPLDGSRVLYALAPEFIRRVMEMMERYGIIIVFAIVLIAGSALGTFMATVINFFIGIFSHIFMI